MSSLEWANFFTMPYAVVVDGIHEHDATLTFTLNSGGGLGSAAVCMKVAWAAVGVGGSAGGFFHLKTAQCASHKGNLQGLGPLDGGVMEGAYSGIQGDSGFFRLGFWELPGAPAGMVLGEWRGTLTIQKPKFAKQNLKLIAKKPKKRPGVNYPWNL